MRPVLLVLLFSMVQTLSAQSIGRDSLQRRYEQQALLIHDNYFIKNNTKYPLMDLDRVLFASPAAFVMYRQGINGYRWGKSLSFLGTASSLGSMILRKKNAKLSNSLIFSGIGLNLIGVYLSVKNKNLIQKAVFQYNHDLLFAPHFRHN
jgi:hypothetical protein